jgi:hypothetical protein
MCSELIGLRRSLKEKDLVSEGGLEHFGCAIDGFGVFVELGISHAVASHARGMLCSPGSRRIGRRSTSKCWMRRRSVMIRMNDMAQATESRNVNTIMVEEVKLCGHIFTQTQVLRNWFCGKQVMLLRETSKVLFSYPRRAGSLWPMARETS